jgi:hypothetical protein
MAYDQRQPGLRKTIGNCFFLCTISATTTGAWWHPPLGLLQRLIATSDMQPWLYPICSLGCTLSLTNGNDDDETAASA